MRLARAILIRLLYGLLSLVFISIVTFLAAEAAPGDPALRLAGEKATPETIARIRTQWGLDRPWPERYVKFVAGAARLDFGRSYYGTNEPVADIVRRNLPMTLRLAFAAIALAAIVGVGLGVLAAVNQNRAADRAVLVLSTLGVTVPNFVLAPLLVYVFSLQLDVLPMTWEVRRVAPDWMYLILPVSILAARPMALLTRLTRASMIETLQQDFVRLAVAKGVPPGRLVFRHALRNAILPVVTAVGTSFGFLLTGSFIVERAFVLPGLGREAIEAIQRNDTPVIQATTLIAGALFVFINLLVDLALPALDPRIREVQV
jgi:peptide/nickel transport system permease protein